MDYAKLRDISLKIFIGFLGITALIGIISVLYGAFGEIQLKILATSSTISGASILSMACAAFIERKKLAKIGLLGILFAISAATLSIVGIWSEFDDEVYWKTTVTFVVIAIAFAHAFLLVLPKLDDKQKWIQGVASISIGMLALMAVVALWGEIEDEDYYRILAAVGIIVGLVTLVVPIFMRLRKGINKGKKQLVLERIKAETYRDSAGHVYRVRETNTNQDPAAVTGRQLR